MAGTSAARAEGRCCPGRSQQPSPRQRRTRRLSPARARRWRAARRRGGESPVFAARGRLGASLLLLLRLHVALFARRATEELICLLLTETARRLRLLLLRSRVGLSTARAAAPSTTAELLLLPKRELVIPFRVEIGRPDQQHFLVCGKGGIEGLVRRLLGRGE